MSLARSLSTLTQCRACTPHACAWHASAYMRMPSRVVHAHPHTQPCGPAPVPGPLPACRSAAGASARSLQPNRLRPHAHARVHPQTRVHPHAQRKQRQRAREAAATRAPARVAQDCSPVRAATAATTCARPGFRCFHVPRLLPPRARRLFVRRHPRLDCPLRCSHHHRRRRLGRRWPAATSSCASDPKANTKKERHKSQAWQHTRHSCVCVGWTGPAAESVLHCPCTRMHLHTHTKLHMHANASTRKTHARRHATLAAVPKRVRVLGVVVAQAVVRGPQHARGCGGCGSWRCGGGGTGCGSWR